MATDSRLLDRARKVRSALKGIRLSKIPLSDLEERFSVLTVVGGIRRVGAIGFAESGNEGVLRQARDVLGNLGVKTKLTNQPLQPYTSLCPQVPFEILRVFDRADEDDRERRSSKLLWGFTDDSDLDGIQTCIAEPQRMGTILGYPQCCVVRDVQSKRNAKLAFVNAVIAAVGPDPVTIRKALQENLQVGIPGETMNDPNILRTDRQFPFLLHIACDSCLDSERSPSATINSINEGFAGELAPSFCQGFGEAMSVSSRRAEILGMDKADWRTRDQLSPAELAQLEELESRLETLVDRLIKP